MKSDRLLTAAVAALLAGGGAALAQGMMGGGAAQQQQMQQQQMNQQQMQNIQQQQEMRRHRADDQSKTQEPAQSQGEQRAQPTGQADATMGGGMQRGEHVQGTTAARTLTSEQKTHLRTTVIERPDAPRLASVNFSIRVGVAVPRTIRVVPVPEEIVAIYPEWAGFLYFVVGDEIVVVDPASYAIIGTLEA